MKIFCKITASKFQGQYAAEFSFRRYECLYPATKPKIYRAWAFWEILEQLLLRMVLRGRFLNENRQGEGRTVTHPIFYLKERRYECLYPATKPKIYRAWKFWEILEQLLLRMVLRGRFLNKNRQGEGRTVTHPIFYLKERRYEYLYSATKPKIYRAWEFWEILEQLLLRMVLRGAF